MALGGTGSVGLYAARARVPSDTDYDGFSARARSTTQTIRFTAPVARTYYLRLTGSYSGVTLSARQGCFARTSTLVLAMASSSALSPQRCLVSSTQRSKSYTDDFVARAPGAARHVGIGGRWVHCAKGLKRSRAG